MTASLALTFDAPAHADGAPRPFLKWVGGKKQLLHELLSRVPQQFGCYFEPFLGGGAMFFALRPEQAQISDANGELVATYCAVRDHHQELVTRLRGHVYDPDHYYAVRALETSGLSQVDAAARMIYLNRCGFNGLYRVNSSGKFNVPFGRYVNPKICDSENLSACSVALQNCKILNCDFDHSVESAQPGDFVYFDPPYWPTSKTASFTGYQSGGFGPLEQTRLERKFRRLAKRGVHVMLSNSDVPAVRELYDGFRIDSVQARRNVNCKGGGRGAVGEVIVRSYYE